MKKKILFILPTLTVGGVERVLVNLANELTNHFDITIITIYDYFDLALRLDKSITVKSFYKTSKNKKVDYVKVRLYTFMLKVLPSKLLYKILVKEKFDIEVAFMRGAATKIISGSNSQLSKKFVWVHSDFTKCTGIFDYFKNKEETVQAYLKFDNIICVSEYVKQKFIEIMGIKKNVIVRYNINQCGEIKEKTQELVNISPFSNSNNFKVCSVGRLVEAKGYDRLLRFINII